MATNNQPAFMPSEKAVQKTNRRKDLPAFYIAEKNADVLRSHLTYREGYRFENDNFGNSNHKTFSHFIAVPMHMLPQYEGNNLDESIYMWELTKMTADQLRKLLSKLGRPGQAGPSPSGCIVFAGFVCCVIPLRLHFHPCSKIQRLQLPSFEGTLGQITRSRYCMPPAIESSHFDSSWLIAARNFSLLFHYIGCRTLHQYRCHHQYSCFGRVIDTIHCGQKYIYMEEKKNTVHINLIVFIF
jgi:hypothetical protein